MDEIAVKLPEALTLPEILDTDTEPLVAPGITIPTNFVLVFETMIADTPPMEKAVGFNKFVPVIVTSVPTDPFSGVKEVMVGACANNPFANPKITIKV